MVCICWAFYFFCWLCSTVQCGVCIVSVVGLFSDQMPLSFSVPECNKSVYWLYIHFLQIINDGGWGGASDVVTTFGRGKKTKMQNKISKIKLILLIFLSSVMLFRVQLLICSTVHQNTLFNHIVSIKSKSFLFKDNIDSPKVIIIYENHMKSI